MTLPIGNRATRDSSARRQGGFTLVELLLVMAMLSIVLAVSAPSLSKFFKGRTLDSEVRRFLALTRYGQSRAAAEGIPMILWIDDGKRAYGLEADSSYTSQDNKAVQDPLSADVQVQVPQGAIPRSRLGPVWKGNGQFGRNVVQIHFLPDGSISETSPDLLIFRGPDQGDILVGTTLNRLKYAIQTNRIQNLDR